MKRTVVWDVQCLSLFSLFCFQNYLSIFLSSCHVFFLPFHSIYVGSETDEIAVPVTCCLVSGSDGVRSEISSSGC